MPRGTLGSVLASLPERRNRLVLYSLDRRAETAPVELEVLARDVASWERDETPDTVSDRDFETALEDLTQTRLPTLSYRGLVEFDPLSGLVGRPSYSAPANVILDWLARVELPSRF